MNQAKRTARKRRNLLNRGLSQDSTSLLGKWARRIYRQAFPPRPKPGQVGPLDHLR